MKSTITKASAVQQDVLAGLSQSPPRLPSKYFYNQRGSQLFDAICKTSEYYPTRTESHILNLNVHRICEAIGSESVLIEPGCGSCDKTRIILEEHPDLKAYVPIDISAEYLLLVAEQLRREFPALPIYPLACDIMAPFSLPELPVEHRKKVVFYPGSTLGNFLPDKARIFLAHMAKLTGKGGSLILGLDQRKDPAILEKAYNDEDGATGRFNLNMLHHLNEQLDQPVFDVEQFEHRAVWNDHKSRIEMHLVLQASQQLAISGKVFDFDRDDYIVTEYSHKYTDPMLADLTQGLFNIRETWKDDKGYFGVYFLEAV